MPASGLGRVKTFWPRETGDAKLNLACCRNGELESRLFARSAVSGGADAHPSRLDRRDERLHAEDVHDLREIVGEHVQGHLEPAAGASSERRSLRDSPGAYFSKTARNFSMSPGTSC